MKSGFSLMLVVVFTGLLSPCKSNNTPPRPYGAVPTASQLAWQKMEYYMFVHFGPNTFTDVEWGNGKEDPKVFDPTGVDCRQWAATAKAAGMKGIIITAKHHDGFCLWPSKYSTHTVRESLWKEGQGDLLKELSGACREYGLKFGVYLSPWDRNNPTYGTPLYNQLFANTLTEVLTGYGDVFEQWFDGANGEGVKKQVYDWDLFHKTVCKNQPNAVIFSDIGPGCRWIGNEQGIAGETNWSCLNTLGFEPGSHAPPLDILNMGNRLGTEWVPGETDVSIRPGWFYSPSTNDKVKSLERLVDLYYTSVGRNSNLLLNVPPGRDGRIHANDSTRLMEFRKAIDDLFKINLAQGATITASATRGHSSKYAASNMLDDNYDTYWATDDKKSTASILLKLKRAATFNRILLQEYIPLGQRVAKFNVEYWSKDSGSWQILSEATTIGYKRILRFPCVTTTKIRINILEALACPVLNNIGLYKAPEQLTVPKITRDKKGMVSIQCETKDPVIHYTTDGMEPSVASPQYKGVFAMLRGGVVRALSAVDNGSKTSEIVRVQYDIAPSGWTIISPLSPDAGNIIDDNLQTLASFKKENSLIVDLGESLLLKGFFYVPVNDVQAANIVRYNFYVGTDGRNWVQLKSDAVFNNVKNNPVRQDVFFEQSTQAKFIKIEPLESVNNVDIYSVNELGVITR